MAGFIHIQGGNGLSVNGITFNAISELSRPYFNDQDHPWIRPIYAPYDEGGMEILSLTSANETGFNGFYRGVALAYQECQRLGRCGQMDSAYFKTVMDSWEELLWLLESDQRFIDGGH